MRSRPPSDRGEFAQQRGEGRQDRGTPNLLALPSGVGGVILPPPGHAYANVTQGVLAVGLSDTILIPKAAQRRNFLALRNSSPAAEIIYVAFNTAAGASSWLRLEANQIVLFDTVVPQDDVHVVCDAATGQVSYGFSTLAFDAK